MEHPIPDLSEPLADLRRLCLLGFNISGFRNRTRGRTMQQFYAQVLFGRIVLTGISILRLLQGDKASEPASPLIDAASTATLTRTLVEYYDVFIYLGIDRVTQEESEFRSALWEYCYNVDIELIIDQIGIPVKDRSFSKTIHQHARDRLLSNRIFRQLPAKQQKDLLRGRKPMPGPTTNQERTRYLNAEKLRGVYKYLSNFTHMHPIAVEMSIPLIFKRPLDTGFLLPLCLETIIQHMCLATVQYTRKLRRYRDRVSPGEWRWIREQLERESALR
jgi:hypothetical protein